MRQLVEELQQLKQDEHEAKQMKQKQAKELNPKKVGKHEITTNKEGEKDDNRGAGKGGKYDNTGGDEKGGDISLTVVQRMNTVYMEGDDTTQGFHFRLWLYHWNKTKTILAKVFVKAFDSLFLECEKNLSDVTLKQPRQFY